MCMSWKWGPVRSGWKSCLILATARASREGYGRWHKAWCQNYKYHKCGINLNGRGCLGRSGGMIAQGKERNTDRRSTTKRWWSLAAACFGCRNVQNVINESSGKRFYSPISVDSVSWAAMGGWEIAGVSVVERSKAINVYWMSFLSCLKMLYNTGLCLFIR